MISLIHNFTINNINLYNRIALIKKIPFSTKAFLTLCSPCILYNNNAQDKLN